MKQTIEIKEIKLHFRRKLKDEKIIEAEILINNIEVAKAKVDSNEENAFEVLANELFNEVSTKYDGFKFQNILEAIEWASSNSNDCQVFIGK